MDFRFGRFGINFELNLKNYPGWLPPPPAASYANGWLAYTYTNILIKAGRWGGRGGGTAIITNT